MLRKVPDYDSVQKPFVTKAISVLKKHGRATIEAPCGVGKTRIATKVYNRLKPKRYVALTSSLGLVRDLLNDIIAESNASKNDRYLLVCSDARMAKEAKEKYGIEIAATTNPETIGEELRKRSGRLVLFGTYQSSYRIQQAYELVPQTPKIDFMVCDEGHYLAGVRGRNKVAVDDNAIPARNRLFMTATMRYISHNIRKKAEAGNEIALSVTTMDDESLYGPVAHSITFKEAIDSGLLVDYEVEFVVITDEQIAEYVKENEDAETLAKYAAIVKRAMKPNDPINSILTFHPTTIHADSFRRDIEAVFSITPGRSKRKLSTDVVSGDSSNEQRVNAIEFLNNASGADLRMVANCKVFGQGTDIVNLRAAGLLGLTKSVTQLVQNIGRTLRQSPGKKNAVIIVPVIVSSEDASADDSAIATSAGFGVVWETLCTMQSMDRRIKAWIDSAGKNETERTKDTGIDLPPNIKVFCEHDKELALKIINVVESRAAALRIKEILSEDLIEAWMISHYKKYGVWPWGGTQELAPDGSTWMAINKCCESCCRGIENKTSLRGIRMKKGLGVFSQINSASEVVNLAKLHFEKFGEWPTYKTREKSEIGISWKSIQRQCIDCGFGTLAKILHDKKLKRSRFHLQCLSEQMIVSWMVDYKLKTGKYPNCNSAELTPDKGTWNGVDIALMQGFRGLAGGSSLAELRKKHNLY